MKQLILSIALMLCAGASFAQSNCYNIKRNSGINAFNNGEYKTAKQHFTLALKCTEVSVKLKAELNSWIEKCNNEINGVKNETSPSTEIQNNAQPQTGREQTPTKGVLINGVRWATCNVAAPGVFADKPEDAGMFYQWCRKTAWAVTGEAVVDWDKSVVTDTIWTKSNDPSPAGWRVPTSDEMKKLLDTSKVKSEWTIINGVGGRRFTDKANNNSIFLPAPGYRRSSVGTLIHVGFYGNYWSSTQSGSDSA